MVNNRSIFEPIVIKLFIYQINALIDVVNVFADDFKLITLYAYEFIAILKEEELRPHKNRYWLHSTEKDESPETYKRKIREINSIYFLAQMVNQYGGDSDVRIISTDEMTGIQALEHRFADKLCCPHQDAKTEFEYIRHGTTSVLW